MSLTLVIANKNYSSWSMRPWVLLQQFEIPFEEVMLKFHSDDWKLRLPKYSPSGLVPALWDGSPGEASSLCIWDSLAIGEYVAETYRQFAIWPRDRVARARARAISAEMHSGFRGLRTAMPMNIRARQPGLGQTEDALKDISRIETIWREARHQFSNGGPFLFGDFCAADAMFAPVVMRFQTYQPKIADDTAAYCANVMASKSVAQWIADALAETEFVADDEPYAAGPAAVAKP